MLTLQKSIAFIIFILIIQTVSAQYEGLQINLEVKNVKSKENHIRFSLFYNDSLETVLGVKYAPDLKVEDYKTWLKRDGDSIIKINKNDFNNIAEMVINLSSSKILKGTKPSNPRIGFDGIYVTLEIVVIHDKICYDIWSPTYKTKERNLESFLDICKEIISLANMNPKKILK